MKPKVEILNFAQDKRGKKREIFLTGSNLEKKLRKIIEEVGYSEVGFSKKCKVPGKDWA